MYSVSKDNLISLSNIRYNFLKFNSSFNNYNVESLNNEFKRWVSQKVYLTFEDEECYKYLFLASKRGNFKFKYKLNLKIKAHQEYIKKIFKSNRPFSNCLFITLTLSREFYLNNLSSWYNITDIVNDYISNLNKKLRKINNKIIYFFKTYELHEDFFPHVHILAIFKKQFRCFNYKGKWRIYRKRMFEWKKGFVDVEAIMKENKALNYLVKYSIKEIETEEDIKLNVSNKRYLLCILWLLRKFTISHTRLRLDFNNSELTYFNPEKRLIFRGLVIIELYEKEESYFNKNYWKILYLVYNPNLKKIQLNDRENWEFVDANIEEEHIF